MVLRLSDDVDRQKDVPGIVMVDFARFRIGIFLEGTEIRSKIRAMRIYRCKFSSSVMRHDIRDMQIQNQSMKKVRFPREIEYVQSAMLITVFAIARLRSLELSSQSLKEFPTRRRYREFSRIVYVQLAT